MCYGRKASSWTGVQLVSGWGSCSVKKVVSVDLIDEVRSEQGTKGGKAQMSPWREGRHSFFIFASHLFYFI